MKDENQLERDITRCLKNEIGTEFEWDEWNISEKTLKKNLLESEKIANINGLWVAYRRKIKKGDK